ncbi:MAG: modified peptide precursor CbpA [Planctomycetes bacterium]|nr:modified peptide precursor CbpA [Planctomycetota bacterium]
MKQSTSTKRSTKVVSYRRTCKAGSRGTGLSHYILVDERKSKKA